MMIRILMLLVMFIQPVYAQQIIKIVDGDGGFYAAGVSALGLKVDSTLSTITISASALPNGAATSALQITGNASLSSLDSKTFYVDTNHVTVSASALPLGAATESTLSILNGKVVAVNTGNVTISSSALPSGASTEATLLALSNKIIGANTNSVTISSSVLPSGAATSALQSALNSKVIYVDTNNITVSASSLPSGAATAALQTILNSKTIYVDTSHITVSASALPLGAATEATLSLLNNKVIGVNTNSITVSSSALPSGASTSALQTTGNTTLSSINTKTPNLSQTTMANSSPVVIASDQSALSVKLQDGAGNLINSSQNSLYVAGGSRFLNITTNATTTVKSGGGLLFSICANSLVSGAQMVLYDNTAGSGTKFGTYLETFALPLGAAAAWSPQCQSIGGAVFTTGLTAVTTNSGDWTIYYK